MYARTYEYAAREFTQKHRCNRLFHPTGYVRLLGEYGLMNLLAVLRPYTSQLFAKNDSQVEFEAEIDLALILGWLSSCVWIGLSASDQLRSSSSWSKI